MFSHCPGFSFPPAPPAVMAVWQQKKHGLLSRRVLQRGPSCPRTRHLLDGMPVCVKTAAKEHLFWKQISPSAQDRSTSAYRVFWVSLAVTLYEYPIRLLVMFPPVTGPQQLHSFHSSDAPHLPQLWQPTIHFLYHVMALGQQSWIQICALGGGH